MKQENSKVDEYLKSGCGRCQLFATPDCKVHDWQPELEKLRQIALDSGLTEELKWGVPVYTVDGKNIVIISAFKESCVLSFPKGVLLKDASAILSSQGKNTQAGRVIRFTDMRQIIESENVLKSYINEAVEVEKSAQKVEYKTTAEYETPAELQKKFAEDADFKTAFDALTPGRQRGYLIYFSQPKQAKTRAARIEKYTPHIFQQKGLNDR